MRLTERASLHTARGGVFFVATCFGLLCVLLLMMICKADAQQPEALRLTLPEAVALAIENNYAVRIADAV